jgi:hypothetical protein
MPKTDPSYSQLVVHARELYLARGQWIRLTRRKDGRLGYAVPSRSRPGAWHLVDDRHCDCEYARRNGLSHSRIGHSGLHSPCSHMLAVRLLLHDQAFGPEANGESS